MGEGTDVVQSHPAGEACDTISSLCAPLFLVPGVMGSRIHMFFGRTWDLNSGLTAMALWVSALSGAKQKNRRALLRPLGPEGGTADLRRHGARERAARLAGGGARGDHGVREAARHAPPPGQPAGGRDRVGTPGARRGDGGPRPRAGPGARRLRGGAPPSPRPAGAPRRVPCAATSTKCT